MTPIILPISELKPGLFGLGKIPGNRNSLPIHSHIKIERTKDGWITLTRSDSERFITVRMEQPSAGPQSAFTASYEYLAGIVKNCGPKDAITLSQNPDKSLSAAFMSHGEIMNVKVPSLPVEQFPAIPRIKGEAIPVPPGLRHSLHQAFECVSDDPMRRSLNGAFLDVSQPGNTHLVSTDGRHMYTSNSFSLPLKQSVIIPRSKFLLWKNFNLDGELQMRVTDFPDAKSPLLVQFSSRRWRFITKAIDGPFPNWRQVLINPGTIKSLLTVDPQRVENLIGKIDSMPSSNPQHHPVGLELVNGKLSLLGKQAGAKEWEKQPFDHVKASGPNVTIFLNRHLLIKALNFGLLDIGIVDSISPMRLSNAGTEMVIMPVRADQAGEPTRAPVASQTPRQERPRRTPQPRPAPVLNDAFVGIKVLKDSFRSGLDVLKSLASSLKEVRRTQKENERSMRRKTSPA